MIEGGRGREEDGEEEAGGREGGQRERREGRKGRRESGQEGREGERGEREGGRAGKDRGSEKVNGTFSEFCVCCTCVFACRYTQRNTTHVGRYTQWNTTHVGTHNGTQRNTLFRKRACSNSSNSFSRGCTVCSSWV